MTTPDGPRLPNVDTDATEEEMKRVGRHVRAARILGEFERPEDLAAKLDLPRFGAKVIGQVERGKRPLWEHEAVALAKVLPVSAEWFYADPESGPSELEQKLNSLMATLAAQEMALRRIEVALGQGGHGEARGGSPGT